MSAIDTILITMLWLFGGAIVFLIFFIVFVIRKHKETIHFKETVKGSFRWTTKKAKFMKDRDGMEWWKTLKKINGKKFFPVPPSRSLILDGKGRKHAEAYLSQNGEIIWLEDPNSNVFEDPETIKKVQPITSNQRAIWLNQERKAVEDQGYRWKQNLPLIIGGAFALIVLVIGGLFISDQYEQSQKSQELNIQYMEVVKENAKIFERIHVDLQDLSQKIDSSTGNSPEDVPD